jgi:hypothetical protein
MTDLRELLDPIAGEPAAPAPDVVSSDVRRGRQALRRRRGLGTVAGGLALAAAVAVGVAVVPNLGGDDPGVQVVSPAGGGSADANPGVDLVAWNAGATPKPISPSVVPEGWTISGSETALVISAPGVSTSPDDFGGKLVAMLSPDATPAPATRPVTVNGIEGTLSVEGDTTILLYRLADDRLVAVQAPSSLHWDDETLVQFAEGLTISAGAPAGRG